MIQKQPAVITCPDDLEPSKDGLRGGKMVFMEGDGKNGKRVGMVWGRCVVTGKIVVVVVSKKRVVAYRDGAIAQDAFSNLTPASREFLISGISPLGWGQISHE